MGWGFRRSIKVAPGVRLNLGKKSASIRIGRRGAGVTKSTTGRTTVSAGLPGTGLFWREDVRPGRPPSTRSTLTRRADPLQPGTAPSSQALPPGDTDVVGSSPEFGAGTAVAGAPDEPGGASGRAARWQLAMVAGSVFLLFMGAGGVMGVASVLAGVCALVIGIAWSRRGEERRPAWPFMVTAVALFLAGVGQTAAGGADPAPAAEPTPAPTVTVTATITAEPTPTSTTTFTPAPAPTVTVTPPPTSAAVAPAPLLGTAGERSGVAGGPEEIEPAPRAGTTVSYANCTEARNAGAAPLYRGDPGYSSRLDRDGDGVACEN